MTNIPPSSLPKRLAKALATLLICTLLGGLALALGPWFYYLKSDRYTRQHDISQDIMKDDTSAVLKRRFLWGSAAGAALGIVIAYLLATDKPASAKPADPSDAPSPPAPPAP